MRFLLYDRVTHLERGAAISGVTSFALSAEPLRAHFDRRPLVPATLLVEAMAQLLGWAVIHAWDFRLAAVLCLVDGVSITDPLLRPGFTATVSGQILASHRDDSLATATITVDGVTLARAERLIFRHFRPVDEAELRRVFAYCSGLPAERERP